MTSKASTKHPVTYAEYNEIENAKLIVSYGPQVYEYSRSSEGNLFRLSEDSPLNILSYHDISPKIRTKLADWLLEVFYAYKCEENTIYLAFALMDAFLFKTRKCANTDLHLLGITCLYISSKFEDMLPLDVSTVKSRISHNKFSEKEIKDKEKQVLAVLDFKIIHASTLDFIKNFIYDFTFNNRKIISQFNTKDEVKNLETTAVFISKMMFHNHEFSHFKSSLKAICCIVLAFDLVRTINGFNKEMESFINEWIKFLVEQSRYEPDQIAELYEQVKTYYYEFDSLPMIQHNLKNNVQLPF